MKVSLKGPYLILVQHAEYHWQMFDVATLKEVRAKAKSAKSYKLKYVIAKKTKIKV